MDAKTTNHGQDTAAAICAGTNTRIEACACGTCARRKSPDEKYQTNKRDVMALLDLVAGCVENHHRSPPSTTIRRMFRPSAPVRS